MPEGLLKADNEKLAFNNSDNSEAKTVATVNNSKKAVTVYLKNQHE